MRVFRDLAPQVRGLGLGAPLLRGCMAHVAQAYPHLTSVVLLVNAQWAAARHIYAGAGFVDVTHLEGFFGASGGTSQDGVVMHRPLPGA